MPARMIITMREGRAATREVLLLVCRLCFDAAWPVLTIRSSFDTSYLRLAVAAAQHRSTARAL